MRRGSGCWSLPWLSDHGRGGVKGWALREWRKRPPLGRSLGKVGILAHQAGFDRLIFRSAMQPHRHRVSQGRELTFQHNAGLGRHGWLRLTPAYSVKLVDDILAREASASRVLDPFSGTATTPLAAAAAGRAALGIDINPFLIWLGRAKTARYSADQLRRAYRTAEAIADGVRRTAPDRAPPLHRIERWWSRDRLTFLCGLRWAIDDVRRGSAARTLLDVAFCRTMMALSNAAFDHQSMSFKDGPPERTSLSRLRERFRRDVDHVLQAAASNPTRRAEIRADDARRLEHVSRGSFDLLLTSPPYPNRMSYIRELRPYMYWMGHLHHAQEAGELDWTAIGGTWGIATSRLQQWSAPDATRLPATLRRSIEAIRHCAAPNAALLAIYVSKYFHDIRTHLTALRRRTTGTERVHYIVGNSSFYGVLVSTQQAYGALLDDLGFRDIDIRVLRKRNSKKELFEFDVSATSPAVRRRSVPTSGIA